MRADEVTVIEPGINAKMNESQAAYGLLQFPAYSGLPSAKPSNLPIATEAAHQLIFFPIFPKMSLDSVWDICSLIKNK
jgi:dTDP-4-amino-4,6-dideoxygalactose transaminase